MGISNIGKLSMKITKINLELLLKIKSSSFIWKQLEKHSITGDKITVE